MFVILEGFVGEVAASGGRFGDLFENREFGAAEFANFDVFFLGFADMVSGVSLEIDENFVGSAVF